VAALSDDDASVRQVAADGIRELVEVLPTPEHVAPQTESPDAAVRAATLYVLSSRGFDDAGEYRSALSDTDHRVRVEAVRALVSVDDADGLSLAAADENREVRIAAAKGLAKLGVGREPIRRLIDDRDPLVRAAALAALGAVGCDGDEVGEVAKALTSPAWQVREGAARALAGAQPDVAVSGLSQALGDPHLDVRKAAVLSLARWATTEAEARDALTAALKDGDADVRAYARQALAV
jgi:HEAT repeat protein